jgi:hypothetical protein
MSFHRDGYHKKAWLGSIISLMILTSSVCVATPAATVGLSGGLEEFRLKEFDSTGARLLSETGNRYVTSAFLDNAGRYDLETRLLYHLDAGIYWGQVNYDGKSQSVYPAQSNLPLMSRTDYQGGRAEAILGYRFKPPNIPHPVEVMGGLGLDVWSRSIHSATTSNGTLVSGIKETYNAYYGKIALGLSNLFPSSWHSHLQLGIKLPFYISEHINLSKVGYDSDLTLSPGNTYSEFIKLALEPQPKDNKSGNVVISIYYDGFRFDPSKAKTATYNGSPVQVWQPETHIDIFGLQIGYRF